MLNDNSSALALLATRRSGKARDMIAPGPSRGQLEAIVALAARTPDHGKLAPWRFVHVARREDFAELVVSAYRAERAAASRLEIEAMDGFARQAPTLLVAIFSPKPESHIPLDEQRWSMGAAGMNLLHAAHAHGFVANWLTGWAAYNDTVRAAVAAPHEQIAGFVFIGTAARPLEDRPRPPLERVLGDW